MKRKLYSLAFENSRKRTSESVQRLLEKQRDVICHSFLSLFFFKRVKDKNKTDRSLAATAEWRALFSLSSPATARRTLMGFSGFSDSSVVKV